MDAKTKLNLAARHFLVDASLHADNPGVDAILWTIIRELDREIVYLISSGVLGREREILMGEAA